MLYLFDADIEMRGCTSLVFDRICSICPLILCKSLINVEILFFDKIDKSSYLYILSMSQIYIGKKSNFRHFVWELNTLTTRLM